jgi:hypothetical protein
MFFSIVWDIIVFLFLSEFNLTGCRRIVVVINSKTLGEPFVAKLKIVEVDEKSSF